MNERPPPPEVSAAALAQISTGIDRLHRSHFGKGPKTTTSYANGDVVFCKMTDVLTPLEHRMLERGDEDGVQYLRRTTSDASDLAYQRVVEDATDRQVGAHLSATHPGNGLAAELFVLDGGPIRGR